MISFTAYGTPAPKGSMKAFMPKGARFPVVTEDNSHTRPWAAIVKDAALSQLRLHAEFNRVLFQDGPVCVNIVFYMPRPQSLPKRVQWHVKKPDIDKLQRAVLDALKGIVWSDDSQVVRIQAEKEYTVGSMPRAEIRVESMEIEQQMGMRYAG